MILSNRYPASEKESTDSSGMRIEAIGTRPINNHILCGGHEIFDMFL